MVKLMRMRSVAAVLAAGILALGFSRQAAAQQPLSVVKATLLLSADAVHSGALTKVAVVAEVAPGYHINDHHPSLDYLIPTELSFGASREFSAGPISYPKGAPEKLAFSAKPLSVYAGEFVIGAAVRVARGLAPGGYLLRAKLDYQACNDHACLPPVSVPLALKIRVAAPGAPIHRMNADVFRKLGSS